MANLYQQWMPQQFTQNTAYVPVHAPPPPSPGSHNGWSQNDAAPAPAYDHIGKPTEPFIHASEKQDEHSIHSGHHGIHQTRPQQTVYQSQFGGLRLTLRFFLTVAILVLLINISWLLFASTHYDGLSKGVGSIQRGPCDAAKRTNTWLHLLINVLSTLLLTGSNAFMSVYSCPSRKEVDRAHERRRWLHVGMLSLRNLGGIARRKAAVVVLLCLTSVPFHLLYVFEAMRGDGRKD